MSENFIPLDYNAIMTTHNFINVEFHEISGKKHSMKHIGHRFPINYCDYPCVLPVWRPIVLLNTFVFLTLLLRLSDSVGTVSENVRFTCNSRKIIPLIACDRSTDLT